MMSIRRSHIQFIAICALVLSGLLPSAEPLSSNAKIRALGELALKVDPILLPSLNGVRNGNLSANAATRSVLSGAGRALISKNVERIPLTLDVPALNDSILKKIAATGAVLTHSSARWNTLTISASMAEIDALTDLAEVRQIHVARRARTRQAGAVGNQADADQNADQARLATGVTGAGQKIGVLSNSCNQTAIGPGVITGTVPNATLSGMTNQKSGDLPAQIQVIDFGPNDVVATDGTFADEGSAMMELIHDIAPNAALVFASGYNDQTTYAENIIKMGQAGCTVTCDDLAYSEEPFFQDGPIAQAIATNYALGIPHFAATGNDYDNGIVGVFTPVTTNNSTDSGIRPPNGDDFHNWNLAGTTPGFLPIDIQPGSSLSPILQWNQPFQSYGLGPGSSVDLDMYLFDGPSATANVLAKSEAIQFAGGVPNGDPLEEFDMGLGYVNNTGSVQRVYLAINHFAGSRANTFFRIVIIDRIGFSFPFGGAGAISIYGHVASNESIACAAIYSAEIESGIGYGADSTHIHTEAFSSLGGSGANGIPYFFDTAGNALSGAPQRRDKPDLSAVDGCTTTFFDKEFHALLGGNNYPPLSNHFPSFFGTSAAAPNAAAVAALLRERASMTTPAQLKKVLQMTARLSVMGVPVTPPERIGAGLIDANAAIQLLPGIVTNSGDQTVTISQNATFTITATGSPTLTYQWQNNGTNIDGATTLSITINNVQTADDGTVFRCIVTNSFGTAISAPDVLHLDQPPIIQSGPIATPGAVPSGKPVTFSIMATGAFGQPVTVVWNFGDGAGDTGASVTHIYAALGTYTVTATVTDALNFTSSATLNIIVFDDTNNDGFPDLDPDADNSGYADFAKNALNLTPVPLTIKHLVIGLNFKLPTAHDTITLSGTLPVPLKFQVLGQHVVALVGGFGRDMILDKHGKAVLLPSGSFLVHASARSTTATYALKVSKATLQPFFAASGLTDQTTKKKPVMVRVTLFFNNGMFDTQLLQSYTATQGKTGKTK